MKILFIILLSLMVFTAFPQVKLNQTTSKPTLSGTDIFAVQTDSGGTYVWRKQSANDHFKQDNDSLAAWLTNGSTINITHGARLFTFNVTTGSIGSSEIRDTTINTSDIKDGAVTPVKLTEGIPLSKLEIGTPGKIVLVNGGEIPAYTTMSGDVTISSTGVTTIGSSKITSSKILDSTIVKNDLAPSLISYIDASGGGTITNFPDEVTLTQNISNRLLIKNGGVNYLQLNDSLRLIARGTFPVNNSQFGNIQSFQTDSVIVDRSANTGIDWQFWNTWHAFKFTPSANTDIVGAWRMMIKKIGSVTNSTGVIQGWLYTDVAGHPGAQIDNIEEPMHYGAVTTTYDEFRSQTAHISLVAGTSYWIVLKRTVIPHGGGQIYFDAKASGTGSMAYSSDGSSWTVSDTAVNLKIFYQGKPTLYVEGINYYSIHAKNITEYAGIFESEMDAAVRNISLQAQGSVNQSTYGQGSYNVSIFGPGSYSQSDSAEGSYSYSKGNHGSYNESKKSSYSGTVGVNYEPGGIGVTGTGANLGGNFTGISGYGVSSNTRAEAPYYGSLYSSSNLSGTYNIQRHELGSSGTIADGTGMYIDWILQSKQIAKQVITETDMSLDAEKSKIEFQVLNAGELATKLIIDSDGGLVVGTGANGSWKLIASGANFIIQKKVSDSWVTKSTIAE